MKLNFLLTLSLALTIPAYLSAASQTGLISEEKPVTAIDGQSGLGRIEKIYTVNSFFSVGVRAGIGFSDQTKFERFEQNYQSKSPQESYFFALDMYFTLFPFLRIKTEIGSVFYSLKYNGYFSEEIRSEYRYFYTLFAPCFIIKGIHLWGGFSYNMNTLAVQKIMGVTYEDNYTFKKFFSFALGAGYEFSLSKVISLVVDIDFRHSLISVMKNKTSYLWGVFFSIGFIFNIQKRAEE